MASVRVQIDRVLALPSLLEVPRPVDTPSSLSPDNDSDNATLTRGEREGGDAVNDLLPGYPLVVPPQTPRANSVRPLQIRNRIPERQHTRHTVSPSDPPPSVINHPDLDRDHRKYCQATSLTVQSKANSTDGDLSFPDSKRDADGVGRNHQVSCLVTGLYTRCSLF